MSIRDRHDELAGLRRNNPAWKLLAADNSALVIGFLEQAFIEPNVRQLSAPDLREKLDDHLHSLRAVTPEGTYPKTPDAYLADWVDPRNGWLRRFYPAGTDVPHFQPTSAVETVISFAKSLNQREFLGTASRMLTVRDLLRQITTGASTTDREVRIAALRHQRDEIEAQMAAIDAGTDQGLDETAIRERYNQALSTARELLADLRQVDEGFRVLDRDVRLRATTWTGPRGEFLESVFGTAAEIGDSDEGRSWSAFWSHLLSPSDQDELNELLASVAAVPSLRQNSHLIEELLRADLFVAAEATQRTVASLSSQLRRFLDEQNWAEGRLIHETIRRTLTAALDARDALEKPPGTEIMTLKADIALPLERPLYTLRTATEIDSTLIYDEPEDDDLEDLLEQTAVDLEKLRSQIGATVATYAGTASLRQVVDSHPIEEGLAELIGYLRLAETEPDTVIDSTHEENVTWATVDSLRRATIPLIVFGEPHTDEEGD